MRQINNIINDGFDQRLAFRICHFSSLRFSIEQMFYNSIIYRKPDFVKSIRVQKTAHGSLKE